MSNRQRSGKQPGRTIAEFLLFVIASAVGVYSLGEGLTGIFEPGHGLDLLWLVVTFVALNILAAQMRRVKQTWPSRRAEIDSETAKSQTAAETLGR